MWNFTLNRRLTFNDARKSGLARQFFTYVLSNALAILFSFSVRLYLPGHVGFFARHRLAAAVVGIVAATGISFSMSRWLVFVQEARSEESLRGPHERPVVQRQPFPDDQGRSLRLDIRPGVDNRLNREAEAATTAMAGTIGGASACPSSKRRGRP